MTMSTINLCVLLAAVVAVSTSMTPPPVTTDLVVNKLWPEQLVVKLGAYVYCGARGLAVGEKFSIVVGNKSESVYVFTRAPMSGPTAMEYVFLRTKTKHAKCIFPHSEISLDFYMMENSQTKSPFAMSVETFNLAIGLGLSMAVNVGVLIILIFQYRRIKKIRRGKL